MDNEDITKALPCKACGKPPHFFRFKDGECGTMCYQIWCATNGCPDPVSIQTKTSERDAIVFWNKAQTSDSHENPVT